jgi:hypothetical protein
MSCEDYPGLRNTPIPHAKHPQRRAMSCEAISASLIAAKTSYFSKQDTSTMD